MVTLHNYFHGATARVRAGRLSPATVRRVRRALCPSDTCTCSGTLGVRCGDQPGQMAIEGGSIELDYRDGTPFFTAYDAD